MGLTIYNLHYNDGTTLLCLNGVMEIPIDVPNCLQVWAMGSHGTAIRYSPVEHEIFEVGSRVSRYDR